MRSQLVAFLAKLRAAAPAVPPAVVDDDEPIDYEECEEEFEAETTDDEAAEWRSEAKRPRKQAAPARKPDARPRTTPPQPGDSLPAATPPAAAAASPGLDAVSSAVLAQLAAAPGSSAPELAKALGQPKSAVNSILYKLASSKAVRKETPASGPPRWSLGAAGAAGGARAGAGAAAASPAAPAAPSALEICMLSDQPPRRVTVSAYRGLAMVDIRQLYEKDGALLPARQGISLTGEQWRALLAARARVDAELAVIEPQLATPVSGAAGPEDRADDD